MTQRKTTFSEEFAIIPKFLYLFAPLSFIAMFCVFIVYMPEHDRHAPPFRYGWR